MELRREVDNWDQHWEQFGPAAEMGPSPKYRRRLILKLLQSALSDEGARILEIGSGNGELAQDVTNHKPGIQYLGLELSQRAVEESARKVPRARFLRRDLLEDFNETEAPDFGATHVVCSEVLEHLDDPAILLRNARRYMAPDCTMILTVPGGPMCDFYKHIGHRRHYSPAQLSELVESSGFSVTKSFGAGWPFFNIFRLFITWRGSKLIKTVSGSPSAVVRFSMSLFDVLFRINLTRGGWQTIVIARYGGTSASK